MRRVSSEDPTAIIGLPLMALTSLLGRFGVDVLAGGDA
jgi:septum formation protein